MGLWHTNGSPNLYQTTRPYNKKKKICKTVDFSAPVDLRVKFKESEKKILKYLDLAKEMKKLWNMKVTFIPLVIGAFVTVTRGLIQGLEEMKIRGDHPNYYIIEIGQSTEKSPGDLRKLAVTQTSENDHQLSLMWKTPKEIIIIIIIRRRRRRRRRRRGSNKK